MVVEVEELLPAAPDAVFAVLSDPPRTAGLGPETHACTWAGEERGVGAVFTGSNRLGELEYDVPCTVVAHEPPTRFAWTVGDPAQPSATWTYELAPADGGTRVVQRFEHGPGRTFLRRAVTAEPERYDELVAERGAMIADGMRQVLQGVGRLLT